MGLYLWLSILGAGLIITEALTGTLYLLLLGLALVATGLIAHATDMTYQNTIILATILSLVAFGIATAIRRNLGPAPAEKPLDIGQLVTVVAVDGTKLRVSYRGTEWDAHLVPPAEVKVGDSLEITDNRANVLTVKRTLHPY